MEKEFIGYNEALALKELGFDEPCFGYYLCKNSAFGIYLEITSNWLDLLPYDSSSCKAPLYQQAFRFFREKYKLKGFISPVEYLDGTDDTYHWCIYNECNSGYDQLTNEQAELECLKKLIEIVKEKE